MPTEADWKARVDATAKKQAPQRMINEAYLKQAAVDASLLTGHPAWDVYLQRLQVWLDRARADLADWRQRISHTPNEADLRIVQLGCLACEEKIAILEACMTLPKEILSHAHESLDNPRQ